MNYKICTTCFTELEANLNNFHKSSTGKFQLAAKCKSCYKKYCEQNKDKIFQKNKKYRDTNHENVRQYKKRWSEENKEKVRTRNQIYYTVNKDSIRRYQNIYNKLNSESKKNKTKQWRFENRDKALLHSTKRRILMQSVANNLTEYDWIYCQEYFNHKCAYCGNESTLEKEHLVPLERKGPTSKENIIPSCRSCNLKKRSLEFLEWYRRDENYSEDREGLIVKYIDIMKGS